MIEPSIFGVLGTILSTAVSDLNIGGSNPKETEAAVKSVVEGVNDTAEDAAKNKKEK